MTAPPRRYDVQVENVREVSLVGAADLAYWTDRLVPEALRPMVVDGRARVFLCAASARFFGVRFREMSISVIVEPLSVDAACAEGRIADDRADGLPTGAFLTQAFNSIRFFAWVERTRFHTPYDFARVEIETEPRVAVTVDQAGGPILRAAMSQPLAARQPLRDGDDGWEGPIHLPRRRPTDRPRLFFGKLTGRTLVHPFDPADTFELPGASRLAALKGLVESRFEPLEWHIRPTAAHGKSKTIVRPGT